MEAFNVDDVIKNSVSDDSRKKRQRELEDAALAWRILLEIGRCTQEEFLRNVKPIWQRLGEYSRIRFQEIMKTMPKIHEGK